VWILFNFNKTTKTQPQKAKSVPKVFPYPQNPRWLRVRTAGGPV
jgi:hypothetical protein